MPAIRKTVLDAVRGILSAAETGFNARFAAACAGYGLAAVEIDWTEDSANVFYGNVASTDQTGLTGRLAIILGTASSVWTNHTLGMKWSGEVQAVLTFEVSYDHDRSESDGIEEYDLIERWVEVIEDVIVEAFAAAESTLDEALAPVGRPSIPNLPEPELLEDGWRQRIPIFQAFHVSVN